MAPSMSSSPTTSPAPSASSITTHPTIAGFRAALDAARAEGKVVGFVPTMGYLHDGHASLMRAAAESCDLVAASIFVNPLQFAPTEDLSSYPRDLERDTEIAVDAGVTHLFTPSVDEMYPFGPVLTTVSVAEVSAPWEGATRPTHFAGVATVVAKLFSIVGPCRAFFGEKDFQQLAVIRRMVADLSIPVDVVGCPIVREPDGLAMSSRNTYLEGADREAAIVLRRALDAGLEAIGAGGRDPEAVMTAMAAVVDAEPLATLDYVAAVDAATLQVPPSLEGEVRLLVAAQVGRPRLIDNAGVTIGADGTVAV